MKTVFTHAHKTSRRRPVNHGLVVRELGDQKKLKQNAINLHDVSNLYLEAAGMCAVSPRLHAWRFAPTCMECQPPAAVARQGGSPAHTTPTAATARFHCK